MYNIRIMLLIVHHIMPVPLHHELYINLGHNLLPKSKHIVQDHLLYTPLNNGELPRHDIFIINSLAVVLCDTCMYEDSTIV